MTGRAAGGSANVVSIIRVFISADTTTTGSSAITATATRRCQRTYPFVTSHGCTTSAMYQSVDVTPWTFRTVVPLVSGW